MNYLLPFFVAGPLRLFFFGLLFAVAIGCGFSDSAIAGEDEKAQTKKFNC